MATDYSNPLVTKKLAEEIKGPENIERKNISLKQFEVFMDRMEPYVKDYLKTFYNADDVECLPVISSINLARRITTQEASIYKCSPERKFVGVSEEQEIVLNQIYEDMRANAMLQKSNTYFKLQSQNTIQILPIKGKLAMRVLLNHQYDVVPDPLMPEFADAYILSGYDKALRLPQLEGTTNSDGANQQIADPNDYEGSLKIFSLWSNEFNFLFDENGNIVSQDLSNPIKIKPFIDIAPAKDFEFFIRQGSSVTDFTIQFNASLTDMSQIVRMQGFAQSYLIADESMMPIQMKIGPMISVKLPVNASTGTRPEFGFAQPNADIAGSMGYLESLVALFLTSRGIDPKSVTTNKDVQTYASGMERLLAMIEKFEASRSDFEIYKKAEYELFNIVKAYVNAYAGTDILQYQISPIPESAYVEVNFEEPEMIETEMDKLAEIEKKLDLGLITKTEAIAEDRGIEIDEAKKIKTEIDQEMQAMMPNIVQDDVVTEDEIIG